jgi:hypothetical protein
MTSVALPVVLGVAALSAALVIGVALAALLQRRSVPYLLVTLAFVTLLARTAVGVAVVTGSVGETAHHTLEHGLDAVMAGLVIAAVYTARQERERSSARRGTGDGKATGGEPAATRDENRGGADDDA